MQHVNYGKSILSSKNYNKDLGAFEFFFEKFKHLLI